MVSCVDEVVMLSGYSGHKLVADGTQSRTDLGAHAGGMRLGCLGSHRTDSVQAGREGGCYVKVEKTYRESGGERSSIAGRAVEAVLALLYWPPGCCKSGG